MRNKKRVLYRRKFKHISVKLFKEQEHTLSDALYIQYNVDAENLNIYDVIYFHRKRLFVSICKSFSKPRRVHKCAEIAKNRMKELIEKEPTISSGEIKNITGYDWYIITRYYMRLKNELTKNNKTK